MSGAWVRVCLAALLLATVAAAQQGCSQVPLVAASAQQPASLALTGVTVIDPATSTIRPGVTILIQGERIAAVTNAGPLPPGTRRIDATGKYVIPGLWDTHVHFMNTGPGALPLLLAHGITSVREMGGHLDWTRAWQAEAARGRLPSPRILTAGPIVEARQYLDRVQRRDEALGGRLAPRIVPYRIGVFTPAEAENAAATIQNLDTDFLKVRSAPSREAYFALLQAARARGLKVAGHQPDFATLVEAADAGQASIEHRLRFDRTATEQDRAAAFAAMARNGTRYMPGFVGSVAGRRRPLDEMRAILGDTASALDPNRKYAAGCLVDWWALGLDEDGGGRPQGQSEEDVLRSYEPDYRDLRAMVAAGVPILAGTDAGSTFVYPGVSLHEELEIMVRYAGLSPWAALRAATTEPAAFFDLRGELGGIAAGQRADLVLLDGNPIEDIRQTKAIFGVVQSGQYLARTDLDRLLGLAQAMATASSGVAGATPGNRLCSAEIPDIP